MNHTTSEALRAYFRRVSGACPGLFNMAHAICGNYDLAEYALRSALLDVWQDNPQNGLGLQEKLRATLKRIAVKLALSDRGLRAEPTWNDLKSPGGDPILDQAAQEDTEIRRCLVLRYGCDLSPARIARITGISVSQLKTVFERFEARVRRRLPQRERRRFEGHIAHTMENWLWKGGADVPDNATLYRAFEAEAAQMTVRSHHFARFLGSAAALVLALICAFIFWLYAVLAQPPVLGSPETTPPPAVQATAYSIKNPNIFPGDFV